MKQIVIINGPNLNLLGKRESHIYGAESFDSYLSKLQAAFPDVQLTYFQSNWEGALIDKLHETGFSAHGIILNPGAYTHTSVALSDAIAAITAPVIEVHISNTFARESFRHQSFTAAKAKGVIIGLGLHGYRLAIEFLLFHYNC